MAHFCVVDFCLNFTDDAARAVDGLLDTTSTALQLGVDITCLHAYTSPLIINEIRCRCESC